MPKPFPGVRSTLGSEAFDRAPESMSHTDLPLPASIRCWRACLKVSVCLGGCLPIQHPQLTHLTSSAFDSLAEDIDVSQHIQDLLPVACFLRDDFLPKTSN